MTLARDDLPLVLDYVDAWDTAFIWRAKTRDDLENVAHLALYTVAAVAVPRNVPSMAEIAHATTSLYAYVVGSTYRLRVREFIALHAAGDLP